jgi:hypothetical protein
MGIILQYTALYIIYWVGGGGYLKIDIVIIYHENQ